MSVRAREISPNRSSEVAGNFLAHENFTLTKDAREAMFLLRKVYEKMEAVADK